MLKCVWPVNMETSCTMTTDVFETLVEQSFHNILVLISMHIYSLIFILRVLSNIPYYACIIAEVICC